MSTSNSQWKLGAAEASSSTTRHVRNSRLVNREGEIRREEQILTSRYWKKKLNNNSRFILFLLIYNSPRVEFSKILKTRIPSSNHRVGSPKGNSSYLFFSLTVSRVVKRIRIIVLSLNCRFIFQLFLKAGKDRYKLNCFIYLLVSKF